MPLCAFQVREKGRCSSRMNHRSARRQLSVHYDQERELDYRLPRLGCHSLRCLRFIERVVGDQAIGEPALCLGGEGHRAERGT